MIRVQTLFESPLVRIERIDHPAGEIHVDPDEEIADHYSIALLEAGEFAVRDRERKWRVTPHDFFLTIPGQVHRYFHREREAAPVDVCVAVIFRDASRDEVAASIRPIHHLPTIVPVNNRRAYLRERMLCHLAAAPTELTLDLIAAELLMAALDTGTQPLYGAAQLSWYARRIDRARCRMDEDFASDHTLAHLAREAGMSPFHFARVFRTLTGIPPHQYLIRRRLAAARIRLEQGAAVTDTCYSVGFRSLSHFITSFRRTYGVSPSHVLLRTRSVNA